MPSRPLRRIAVAAASTGLTVGAVSAIALTAAGPAGAAPAKVASSPISVSVSGDINLNNPDSNIRFDLHDTALTGLLSGGKGNSFVLRNGNLPIAPVTVSFKAYGFLPITGTAVFTQVSGINATVTLIEGSQDGRYSLATSASYIVSLRNVSISGTKANVGAYCRTVQPVKLDVTDLAGGGYSLSDGGYAGSTFDLGAFQTCGGAQKIINDVLPGPGNSVALTLGGAVFTDETR